MLLLSGTNHINELFRLIKIQKQKTTQGFNEWFRHFVKKHMYTYMMSRSNNYKTFFNEGSHQMFLIFLLGSSKLYYYFFNFNLIKRLSRIYGIQI